MEVVIQYVPPTPIQIDLINGRLYQQPAKIEITVFAEVKMHSCHEFSLLGDICNMTNDSKTRTALVLKS